MEKKRENYVAPIAETIEIVIEQAILNSWTEVPDFDYGGALSNQETEIYEEICIWNNIEFPDGFFGLSGCRD